MKTFKLLLTFLVLCIATVALAEDIKIPTTEKKPFDLTMGTITSEDTHEHFTSNGLEWMCDGDCITFTLQNEKDIDYDYVIIDADTGNDGVTIDFNLKNQKGITVADTTFSIERKGWYNTKSYLIKQLSMAKGEYTLTLTFHSKPGNTTGNIKSINFKNLESVVIPTDEDKSFDLTRGFILSNHTREHFTDFGVENMYNNDSLIYNLRNEEDLDVCNVYVDASTTYSNCVSIDLNIKKENGDVVVDTTYLIENKGWNNTSKYSLSLRKFMKGKYILTLAFHQSYNNSWGTANIGCIAFKKPQNLKPGDNLDVVNPEFDDGLNGWTRENGLGSGTYSLFDNNISLIHFNYGKGSLSQTIYNLPDGLYLLRLNAYDSTPDWNGTDPMEKDVYVFLNDRMVPMKTAYDDAVSYRNIYRLQDDVTNTTNSDYRRRTDGRWVPTHQREWNEALAMKERLYENCVVVAITNGQATLGWKKTVDRGTRIPCDHARLTYLAESTDLKAYANSINATIINNEDVSAAIERTMLTNDLKERLSTLEQAIRTELVAKRAHAPQAIAEANVLINADLAYQTDVELIDAILHAEHLMQRLQLPFYDIKLTSPGTLANLIEAQGIQTTDTISIKLSGTLNDEDLAALKTFTCIMELDLGETTLTSLPDQQFADMKFLTWMTLPSTLESIGNRTFLSCWRLRDMKLPSALKSIDEYAFWSCINLDHAIIPEGVTVGNGVYSGSGIKSVVLPKSMKEVPYNIFSNCYELADIQFSKQEIIGQDAFANCRSLTTINLPEGLQRMNSYCFGGCTNLTNATLPSSLILVSSPFGNCRNLKELTSLCVAPPYPYGSSIHGDLSSKGFILYVPKQSVEAYQEADRWNEFDVVGIDVLPSLINIISPLTFDTSAGLPADYKANINFEGLYSYWGGDVSSMVTYGTLTVEGSNMLSAKRLKTVYNPFAQRSMANRGAWGTTHTSLINNGQMRADTVTVDLRLYENCWEFLTFPFDVRVSDIRYRFADVPLIIYGYDAQKRAEGKHSETWVEMTADSILHAGKGYIWQTTIPQNQIEWRSAKYGGDFNYHYNIFYVDAMQNATKPLFFRSDDVEVTLEKYNSEYAHDRSWNFIGNPYPCYFDIRSIETTAPLIVWTFTSAYDGRYQAYSPLDDDLILFPGQAFFMQCPLEQDKVVFLKEGRQHNLEVHYDMAESPIRARAMAMMPQREVFNLVLKGERSEESDYSEKLETLDRTRFVVNPYATLDYEPGRDASKFFSLNAGTAHLYTHENGVRYAIDERPLADGIVQLGLQLPTRGTYTLSLDTKACEAITLIDQNTGKETRLDGNSEGYTFDANAGTCDNRFILYLGDAATGITEVATPLQQGEQQFYDLQGRPVSHPQKGIYIQNNKKVIIK